jgi:hypothetical protein
MAENPLALAVVQNDHDLLVELKTEMRLLREDIREMKDGNTVTLEDHESRIRFLERWVWLAVGALGIIEVAFTALSNNGFKV